MARVLGIGLATVDYVCTVESFPRENSKGHALSRRMARGGNAATTLVVLGQLGHETSLGAVLAPDPEGTWILDDLRRHDVDTSYCRMVTGGKSPVSHVLLNRENGSRTVIHHRELPEFGLKDFSRIDLTRFDWVHLEGRTADTRLMLDRIKRKRRTLPVSVEIERQRPGADLLLDGGATLLIFAQDFVRELGFSEPAVFLREIQRSCGEADLVCPCGEAGVHALDRAGRELFVPAQIPRRVVDTLGAGDTFNAGLIDGLLRAPEEIEPALVSAARLAGRKCAQEGVDGLGAAPTSSA